jgi:hypothetical protein
MGTSRSTRQPDLFDELSRSDRKQPPEFIARIRGELMETLARVQDAPDLPWRDLTAATLAELRFHSIAGWLPDDEAKALRASFQREMSRLYLIVERDSEA